jgi:hypothetical protein
MIAILKASSFLQKHTLDFDGMVLLDDLEYNIWYKSQFRIQNNLSQE